MNDELDRLSAAALAPSIDSIGGNPDGDVVDRDVRTTPREMTLARFVYDVFLSNEQFAVEQGFHEIMRESALACQSKNNDSAKTKLSQLNLPQYIFEPITEVRRFAALSQLKEIFSSSGNFPAKISATSRPNVPSYVTEKALEKMLKELAEICDATGVVPDAETAANFGRDRISEILNAEREHANDEVALLERRVRDDFEEASFIDEFNKGMEYLSVYGTALWEGPVPCVRWKNDYSGKQGERIVRKAHKSVTFRAINPLDVYPSRDQVNCSDGSICIRVRIPSQELWLNAKEVKGCDIEETGVWFSDTITDLLAKYPQGGVKLSWQDGEEKNRELRRQSYWQSDSSCMMEGISYYGQIRGNLLIQMGVLKSHSGEKINADDYYEVNALVIDEYCVYCRIVNPCLERPLVKATFYDIPDSFFGGSIAERLKTHQEIINGCLKSLIVNMNMTSAPIAWISDIARLQDKSPNALKLVGGKVFAFKGQVAGVNVSSGMPMGVLRVDSRISEIIAVLNHTITRIDDVSGIPSYTYGQNVTGGAGRTYSGLAMLTEAANRVMKMIIDCIDRAVIRKMVRIDAYRLMLYDDSIAYTGDVEIVPTGVMGLILKQQEMQKVLQLFQMVSSNPLVVQKIGDRGLLEILRQVLETYDVANIDNIIPSKEDLELSEAIGRVQKLMQVQAAQEQGQGGMPQNQPQEELPMNGGGAPMQQVEQNRDFYERGGSEYRMPREAMPGSANERRGSA